MNVNFKQLETFVWVATLGSFRRAAERLNTTQPNVSVRISSLEAEIKSRLFERDAGSVVLTPTGKHLLEYARRILSAADEFVDQAGSAKDRPGIIRLGVTEMIAQTWLSSFLREMRAQYPSIVVELMVDLSVNLKRELVEHSVDLAFLNGPISDHAIQNIDLGQMPFVWVASPAVAASLVSAAHFAQQPIFLSARNTRPFVETETYFRENSLIEAKLVPSNNLAACLQMTIDGLGIAILPKALTRQYLRQGVLKEVSFPWVPAPLVFTASYGHTPSNLALKNVAEIAGGVALSQGQP